MQPIQPIQPGQSDQLPQPGQPGQPTQPPQSVLETPRLLLRPWRLDDAPILYELARDPRIGPAAGWPVHTSVADSREIIANILSADETYAVVLKATGTVVGSAGLLPANRSNLTIDVCDQEIGYWIGVAYWGQGLIPEAVQALLRHAFTELDTETVWCGYFDGNTQSQRVQEKCGFRYHHTNPPRYWETIHETKTEHVTCLTRERWQQLRTQPE